MVNDNASEWQEQRMLCQYLDMQGYIYASVPNFNGSGKGGIINGSLRRLTGQQKGFPDLLVFSMSGGRKFGLNCLKTAKSDILEKASFPDAVIVNNLIDGIIFDVGNNNNNAIDTIKGIAIEMKSTTGKARPEQKEWARKLQELGWLHIFGFGFEDAKQKIEAIMKELS